MFVSSRTPEGLPNRCSICGSEFLLEPSMPPGDAPCPSCGHLLWWLTEELADTPIGFGVDTRFMEDLRVEPVNLVELAMAIEDAFGVAIPDEEYSRLKTVGDLMRLIRRSRSSLKRGAQVTIREGVFSGFDGEIAEIDEQEPLATVDIPVFGRVSPIVVPLAHLRLRET